MQTRSFPFAASALVLGLATLVAGGTAQAQPMFDRVDVTLPYSVTIDGKILQPGNYVIQQLESQSGASPVLLIYGDNGMRFETSALSIPALENRTQPDTRVILHHIGNDYYFDKIWVQGKNYGYEFPLPNSVKQRELEAQQPVTVSANASPVPAAPAPPVVTPQPEPAAQPTTVATPPPDTSANREMSEPPPTPAPAPAMASTPTPAPAPELTPNPNTTNEAPAMPHTDLGWLTTLLSGGALAGLGAKLRRKA